MPIKTTYEDMITKCDLGYCSRYNVGYNPKTCIRESKRKDCYRKLEAKESKAKFKTKSNKDKDEQFLIDVWKSEFNIKPKSTVSNFEWKSHCKLWNVLTKDEQDYIIADFKSDLYYLQNNLDVAHIKPKGANPELKYDLDNVTIIGRYFHRLLTDMKHPVLRDIDINNNEVEGWHLAAKYNDRSYLSEFIK